MKTLSHRGFTLIEVMLFLAISGMMAVGLLATVGANINAQRYRDATTSLVTYLQSEYDKAVNVQNDRPNTMACSDTTISETGSGQARGTSECVIIGRFITTEGGRTFTSRPVYAATGTITATSSDTDRTAINKTSPFISSISSEKLTYTTEWQTQVVTPHTNNVYNPSILIVRSPLSGALKTYVGAGNSLSSVMTDANDMARQADRNLCINPDGLIFSGRGGAVIINNIGSGSGVKSINTGSGAC